jgi:hypothetical protein
MYYFMVNPRDSYHDLRFFYGESEESVAETARLAPDTIIFVGTVDTLLEWKPKLGAS